MRAFCESSSPSWASTTASKKPDAAGSRCLPVQAANMYRMQKYDRLYLSAGYRVLPNIFPTWLSSVRGYACLIRAGDLGPAAKNLLVYIIDQCSSIRLRSTVNEAHLCWIT